MSKKDKELVFGILRFVDMEKQISQRSLADKLGIALGVTNACLKRCIKKGLIKMEQMHANTYMYCLTPKGFAEKAKLARDFLHRSLHLYRSASRAYLKAMEDIAAAGFTEVVLCGESELTEIAMLWAGNSGLKVVGVFGNSDFVEGKLICGKPALKMLSPLMAKAALLITSIAADEIYQRLIGIEGVEKQRIFMGEVLELV